VVTVSVDGVIVGTATVAADGSWSLPGVDLSAKADSSKPIVSVAVTDLAGNPASDTQAVEMTDSTAPVVDAIKTIRY
jgi:hypothetical protein